MVATIAAQINRGRVTQPPWRRSHPAALCQDDARLSLITDYDYDLSSKAFLAYLTERGLIHLTAEPGSARETYLADFRKTRSDYLADPYFHCAQAAADGTRYRYTEREMEIQWEILVSGRARLQDCWEIWINQKKGR